MAAPDRKAYFVNELRGHYEALISGTHRVEVTAARGASAMQEEARSKEDAKSAASEARVAASHRRRREQAVAELEQLLGFAGRGLPRFGPRSAVDLGALFDVSIESEDGSEERTLFMLPVGAGTELSGPGGDGFISVVTPSSPVGRALRGARIGDAVEVVIEGQPREWTVVDLM